MRSQIRRLRAGDVISFSAGHDVGDPRKFRRIRGGEDRLANVVCHFPKIASVLHTLPIIVNCYPATLGAFPSAATCDTYLRQSAFSRALDLCSWAEQPAIILGQPLVVANLLFHHVANQGIMPQSAIICVGGYYCPLSLEKFIRHMPEELGCKSFFFHAYGMAEADFAVFVGERDSLNSLISYIHVAPHVLYQTNGNELQLRRIEDEEFHGTGDQGECDENGRFSIRSGHRLDPRIVGVLESWTNEDWKRKTGYLRRLPDDSLRFQMRKGVTPNNVLDIKFGAFQDEFEGSFLDKPDWSISELGTS